MLDLVCLNGGLCAWIKVLFVVVVGEGPMYWRGHLDYVKIMVLIVSQYRYMS